MGLALSAGIYSCSLGSPTHRIILTPGVEKIFVGLSGEDSGWLEVVHPEGKTLVDQVRLGELNPAIFADWLDDHRNLWTAKGDTEKVLSVLREGW